MSESDKMKSPSPRAASGSEDPTKNHAGVKGRKRTRTGCLTCRKRRIKCDEQRPTCHNCFKSKRQCEGYQTRLQFRPQGDYGAPGMYPFSGPFGPLGQPYLGQQGQFAHIRPRPYPQALDEQTIPPAAAVGGAVDHWAAQTGFEQPQMPGVSAAQMHAQGPALAYLNSYTNAAMMGGQFAHYYSPNPSSGAQFPLQSSAPPGGRVDAFASDLASQSSAGSSSLASDVRPLPAFLPSQPNPISANGHVWNPNIHAYDSHLYSTIPPEQFDFTETVLEDDLCDVDSDDNGNDEDDDDQQARDAFAHSPHSGLPLMLSMHPTFNPRTLRSHDAFLNTPNILAHYEPQWDASPLMDPTTARIFGHFIAITACHLSLGQRRSSNPSLLFQQKLVPRSQQGLWTYVLPQKALSNQALMHAMLALASLQISMLQGTDRHTARKHYHFAIKRNGRAVGLPDKRTTVATIATTLLLACFEVWAADHGNWNSHLLGARQLLLEVDFVGKTRQIRRQQTKAMAATATATTTAAAVEGAGPSVVTGAEDPYASYLRQKAGPSLQMDAPEKSTIERMMGYKVPYGDHKVVLPAAGPGGRGGDEHKANAKARRAQAPRPPLTQGDVDTYEMYCDLFWFYAKQDVYYSTISSYPLLLPYERWGDCPPRAPLGRIDAIYGTSDHLVLILGRICRFLSEDLVRKKRAVAANGGQWRPPGAPPAGNPPERPPGGTGPAAASTASGEAPHGFGSPRKAQGVPGNGPPPPAPHGPPPTPTGPSFMGMMPEPPTPRMPAAFKDTASDSAVPPAAGPEKEKEKEEETSDLQAAYDEALGEWTDIQAALAAFEGALSGPEWQELPLHAAMPIATHFGSAVQYGDYRVADIWAVFYVARIIMARVHPSMPPAALMAAGVAAGQTARWANRVGRIVFGMQTPVGEGAPLNPTFASVLTQNMFCLFFAGVQFQEPAQRLVTVQRLQYIAEKVGHESASLIAAGLETCWINAFERGRGPEWRRMLGLAIDRAAEDDRTTEFRTLERREEGTTIHIRSETVRRKYGMGVLGLASDFATLGVADDGENDKAGMLSD